MPFKYAAILSGLLVLSSLSTVALPTAGYAQSEEAKDWTLNLRDVDIRAFLQQVSAITGENFVVDPAVSGKVSVIATTPMTKDAVHELFLTVLRVNGFAAVPSGQTTRIVPLTNAKGGEAAPANVAISGQKLIMRVIPVNNVNVDDAVKVLKPMVSAAGFIEGSASSNAIVVNDYADNVAQMEATLAALGQETPAEVEIIHLKQGWVGNLVPLIESMGPVHVTTEGDKNDKKRFRVIADERTNSIVVRGDNEERAQIRKLVQTLDQKNPVNSDMQMFRLQNADAASLAKVLRGIVFNQPIADNASSSAPLPAISQAGNGTTSLNGTVPPATLAAAAPSAGPGPASAPVGPGGTLIQADTALNAIVVRAEPSVMSEIRQLIEQLDVRRPQVMIEAAIVEISTDQLERLGLQFAVGDNTQTINSGGTNFTNGTGFSLGKMLTELGTTPLTTGEGLIVRLGSKNNFNVLIQALRGTAGANLLSTPSITTLDNEEAKIVVGQNVPFRTGIATLQTGVANPFTTIERQDIGITLKVVPQIHSGKSVRLNIEQEVSSLAAPIVDLGAADIITNKRTINTKVLAQDGETIVLGGLMEDDVSQSISKVPVLGDIPVMGNLFSNKENKNLKRSLFIFLRPTVMVSHDEIAATTQRQYKRVYDLQMGTRKLGDPEDEQQVTAYPTDQKKLEQVFNAEEAASVEAAASPAPAGIGGGLPDAPKPAPLIPTPPLSDKVRYMDGQDEENVPPAKSIFDPAPKKLPLFPE